MLRFKQFIAEQLLMEGAGEDAGPTHNKAILHLVHHDHMHLTDDNALHGSRFALRSLKDLHNRLQGKAHDESLVHSTKADGKIAVSIGKHKAKHYVKRGQSMDLSDGPHYVKYKGTNAPKCFTQEDIDRNYGPNSGNDKPHVHKALSHVLAHAHHVIPEHEDNVEYQADIMHSGHDSDAIARVSKRDNSVQPNYLRYRFHDVKPHHGIGVALTAKSKLDEDGNAHDIHQNIPEDAASHSKIHKFDTRLNTETATRHLESKHSSTFTRHMNEADKIQRHMESNGHHTHLNGHGEHMQQYLNSLMDSGDKASLQGYKDHLQAKGQKEADKVKKPESKQAKLQKAQELVDHVENHHQAFQNALDWHHHVHKAGQALVPALMKGVNPNMSQTTPEGTPADHEGIVTSTKMPKGMMAGKLVPDAFRRGNRAQGQKFKKAAKKNA